MARINQFAISILTENNKKKFERRVTNWGTAECTHKSPVTFDLLLYDNFIAQFFHDLSLKGI